MYFLCCYFRSPAATIAQDLHHTLLSDLITGYFGNDGKLCNNTVRWKMHFRRYCPHPTQFNCSILENFHYLEQKGLLRVGKYDVLKDLFRRVDTTALRDIKSTAEMIENIKATPIENKGLLIHCSVKYPLLSLCFSFS